MRDTLLGLTTVVILFGVVYMTQANSSLPKKNQNKKLHSTKIESNEIKSNEVFKKVEKKKDNKPKKVIEISKETVKNSKAEKRAQMYIDRDWMPDENIDKDTYLRLGGRYTQYWDNLKNENTFSTTTPPPNNTQKK